MTSFEFATKVNRAEVNIIIQKHARQAVVRSSNIVDAQLSESIVRL